MDDAKRIAEIEAKLKRLNGKAELNGKQWQYFCELVGERESIRNPNWREDIKNFLDQLGKKNVDSGPATEAR